MIPSITVSKILEAAQIVDVVSDFVTLKRAGANLKGLCPFHDDRTPSFMVSPARNYCKCFACGKGGSPVGFIMEHLGYTYPDALRYLARKYGITVEEQQATAEERQRNDDRESMYILNQWATNWFKHQMYDTSDGRAIGLAYFRNRGFRDDILERFQVGFCPDSREVSLSADAIKEGYQEKYLVNVPNEEDISRSLGTGLSLKREDGSLRDRFRGRVIWPIFSSTGHIAGFGGRVLDAATKGVNVKYLNSPESIVYSKRRELFGFEQGKTAARKFDLVYVVEGYTDVMAMHQAGIENVVAASGTAFTPEQGSLIKKRLSNNVVLIFDGDEAGIKAAKKSLNVLLPLGMNVKMLNLPDNDDPDSYSRKHTPEEFKEYLDTHQVDFVAFKINVMKDEVEKDVTKTPILIHDITQTIALIPDEITRSVYIRRAAQLLGIKEDEIQRSVSHEIRVARDEQERERFREEQRKQITNDSIGPQATEPAGGQINEPSEQTNVAPTATEGSTITPRRYAQERILAQIVMLYGELVLFETELNEGEIKALTVVEFLKLRLEEHEIEMAVGIYRRMVDEALEQIAQQTGTKMLPYFLHHPDYEMNALASDLFNEKGSLETTNSEELPRQIEESIDKMVANIKLDLLKTELDELQKQIAKSPIEQQRQLLAIFMEKQSLRMSLETASGR